MKELQRILEVFNKCQQTGTSTAMATIVQTSGSVYRRAGARMLLTQHGEMISAISGGCLEADVLARAQWHLQDNQSPTVVRYDSTHHEQDLFVGFGLGCHGMVNVLIESLSDARAARQLDFISDCWQSHQYGAIATVFSVKGIANLTVGSRIMVKADGTMINQIDHPAIAETLLADAQQALTTHKTSIQSYQWEQGEISVLFEVIAPPLPLLVFGAGYDAIPVVKFAKQLGWQVTVIDHRPDYLTRDRFPEADHLLECNPDHAEDYQHLLTPQAVAVVMTHRYLTDLAFLKHLIPSAVRYLGILGPQHRMEHLWQDLAQSEIVMTAQQQQRVYNPVGLDLAADTPEEIALSIVAEMQAVIGGGSGTSLRDRAGTIHPRLEHSWVKLESSS